MQKAACVFIMAFLVSCQSLSSGAKGDLSEAVVLRDRFVSEAAASGIRLEFTPEIKEWTRPSLISWRQQQRTVAVPVWSELSEAQRAALAAISPTPSASQRFFNLLFRWFLIPHELTHALQESASKTSFTHYQSERFANDVGVAFFMKAGEEDKLLILQKELFLASERIESPVPPNISEQKYFDDNYDTLGRTPAHYAYFQFRFILSSIQRRNELKFDELMKAL